MQRKQNQEGAEFSTCLVGLCLNLLLFCMGMSGTCVDPPSRHNRGKAVLFPARGPRKWTCHGVLAFLSLLLYPTAQSQQLPLWPSCNTAAMQNLNTPKGACFQPKNQKRELSDLRVLWSHKTKFKMNAISGTQNYTTSQIYSSGRNSIFQSTKVSFIGTHTLQDCVTIKFYETWQQICLAPATFMKPMLQHTCT